MSTQEGEIEDSKSGPVMAQKMAQSKVTPNTRRPKTHQDFWKERLVRRTYTGPDGKAVEIPEWQVRIAFCGRREWFNLETPNQSSAAIKARDIYLSLVAAGWETTLGRFKPGVEEKSEVCTVGEFL